MSSDVPQGQTGARIDTSDGSAFWAQAKSALDTFEATHKRLQRCLDRSVVVMIGDTGHYVSQAVADELERLRLIEVTYQNNLR